MSRDPQSLTRCQQSPAAGSQRAVTIFGSAAGQEEAAEKPPPSQRDNVSGPHRDSVLILTGTMS